MRKLIILIIVMCCYFVSSAQNTFPTTGNVGIGTTSPSSLLTVNGDITATGTIGGNGMYHNVLKITPFHHNVSYFYMDTNIPATDAPSPQIKITGYAYSNPKKSVKLTLSWYHYAGNFYWSQWQSDLGYYKPSRVRLGIYNKAGQNFIRIEVANDDIYFSNYSISATDASNGSTPFYSGWTYTEGEMPTATTSQILTVAFQEDVSIVGKLGIGTISPTEKLEVNGKIRAKEVKVEISGWPDYVFSPSYNNMPLAELEKFIQKNNHLPEIPSAAEAELNGIELGEMNKLLLKKIEELTLYIIEQNKRFDQLENKKRNKNR